VLRFESQALPFPLPFVLLEGVLEEDYLEIEEMIPRDCEYSEGRILMWEMKSGSHYASAHTFVDKFHYALVQCLQQNGAPNSFREATLLTISSGGRNIVVDAVLAGHFRPDDSITPSLGHIGTATVVVETASSETLSHVLQKVPFYFDEGHTSTDVQVVVIFSLEFPPNPPQPNKRPAMCALLYQRRHFNSLRGNGKTINDALCLPIFAREFSSGANGFLYPQRSLQGLVGDTPGLSLFSAFPNPAPPPCQGYDDPNYLLQLGLDDIFFI
jgi:hypothetical protein